MLSLPDPLGPVELIEIGFEGNRFTGDIAPALIDLMDSGMIRVIDMAVISKDADGTITLLEMQDLSGEVAEALIRLTGDISGLLSEADLLDLAEALEPETTTLSLLIEHLWADRFAKAVRAANGRLILSERIPHDVVETARALLIAAAN